MTNITLIVVVILFISLCIWGHWSEKKVKEKEIARILENGSGKILSRVYGADDLLTGGLPSNDPEAARKNLRGLIMTRTEVVENVCGEPVALSVRHGTGDRTFKVCGTVTKPETRLAILDAYRAIHTPERAIDFNLPYLTLQIGLASQS